MKFRNGDVLTKTSKIDVPPNLGVGIRTDKQWLMNYFCAWEATTLIIGPLGKYKV